MSDIMQANSEKEKTQVASQPSGKYKRVDVEGGFINDEDEIEYYKTTQRRDVLNNLLLGDYNNVGDYVVKEPVMKELVVMYKVLIDSYFNNVYFVKSKYSTAEIGQLQFCIMIKKHEDVNKATAILKLLEPVKKAGGYVENTNSFTIATYTDLNDEYFLSKVKKVFRIVPADDTAKQDESEVSNIILRLRNQLKLRTLSASAFAELEKNHYNARIEKLRSGGCDDLLDELKTLMNKAGVFIDPTSPTYYQTMNELLDQAIDNIGKKNPKRLKQINRELADVNKEFNAKSSELNNKVKETKDREDYFAELAKKEADLRAKVKLEAEKKASESKAPSKPKPTAAKSKPKVKGKAATDAKKAVKVTKPKPEAVKHAFTVLVPLSSKKITSREAVNKEFGPKADKNSELKIAKAAVNNILKEREQAKDSSKLFEMKNVLKQDMGALLTKENVKQETPRVETTITQAKAAEQEANRVAEEASKSQENRTIKEEHKKDFKADKGMDL